MQAKERSCAEKSAFAIDELKLLQAVIARHEHHVCRVYGLLLAFVVASTAAAFFGHLRPTWKLVLAIALFLLGFGVWLAYHRLKIFRATIRALDVETHIRRCTDMYEGPRINESLLHPVTGKRASFERMFGDLHVWAPLCLAAIAIAVAFAAAPAAIVDTPPPAPPGGGAKLPDDTLPMAIGTLLLQSDPARSVINSTFVLAGLLLVVGAALLFFGRDRPVKAAGGVVLLAGLLTHGALIKEVKFGNIFNFEKLSLALDLAIDKKLQGLSLAPQHLGAISNFPLGTARVDKDSFPGETWSTVEAELGKICRAWSERVLAGRAMLLIVGSTDRVQLTGEKRRQFEANAGLARARAESVKAYLRHSCWYNKASDNFDERSDVLVLVSGPQSTPAIDGKPAAGMKPIDFPEDRRVDFYLLSAGAALPPQPALRPVDVSAKKQ